jgi:hypothetical protein
MAQKRKWNFIQGESVLINNAEYSTWNLEELSLDADGH